MSQPANLPTALDLINEFYHCFQALFSCMLARAAVEYPNGPSDAADQLARSFQVARSDLLLMAEKLSAWADGKTPDLTAAALSVAERSGEAAVPLETLAAALCDYFPAGTKGKIPAGTRISIRPPLAAAVRARRRASGVGKATAISERRAQQLEEQA